MNRRELLRIACAGAVGLLAVPLGWTAAADKRRKKVLYFTRSAGYLHAVVQRKDGKPSLSEQALTEMGRRVGFEVDCSDDGSIFDHDLDPYDAFVFFTCGDLTKPGEHGKPMSAEGKRRLLEAVAAGKGFVGFHSAAATFPSPGDREENQAGPDPYIAMLGGEFVRHGGPQEASLLLVSRFPVVRDLGCAEGLSFYDEWFALKNFAKDLHAVLLQETDRMQGDCYRRPPYPCTWARKDGKGRVFYTSLGHQKAIWTNPFFQAVAMGGLAWALGSVEADVKPNLQQVAPHAAQLKS